MRNRRRRLSITACCLFGAALLAAAGCSASGKSASNGAGASESSGVAGASMAGPVVDINVTPSAVASRPKPWVLSTPQSAVRSYLDWISYAYRTGNSSAAKATMTSYEEVRVDSYVQFNIEKTQLIDQTLTSITFGKPSVGSTSTLVPAKETWTYRYVSIKPPGGKVVGGPYTASYDTTYTVLSTAKGWLVDSVAAESVGKVK